MESLFSEESIDSRLRFFLSLPISSCRYSSIWFSVLVRNGDSQQAHHHLQQPKRHSANHHHHHHHRNTSSHQNPNRQLLRLHDNEVQQQQQQPQQQWHTIQKAQQRRLTCTCIPSQQRGMQSDLRKDVPTSGPAGWW